MDEHSPLVYIEDTSSNRQHLRHSSADYWMPRSPQKRSRVGDSTALRTKRGVVYAHDRKTIKGQYDEYTLVAADSDTQVGPKLFVVQASNALGAITALRMPRANPERRFIDGGAAVGISRELDLLVAIFISSKRMRERWTARPSVEP